MTVDKLKILLEKHGLKKSGTKKDLIDRLLNPPPLKQLRKKQKNFCNLRAKILHHTPLCLEEHCSSSPVYADFIHMLQHPSAQEKLKALEEQIQRLIPKKKKQRFGDFKPYWIRSNDGNLPTSQPQNIQIPALNQEDLIPVRNLNLATLEHIIQRKISETRWRTHGKNDLIRPQDQDFSKRYRGSIGYSPKCSMEYLTKAFINKREAISVAVKILKAQLETFV
jgi:hypothetical protein